MQIFGNYTQNKTTSELTTGIRVTINSGAWLTVAHCQTIRNKIQCTCTCMIYRCIY